MSNSHKAEMLDFIETNPNEFEALVELSVADKQPYSWRAAWLLSNCIDENDNRIKEFIPVIINTITVAPDGQKRDLINVLRKMKLTDDIKGLVFDICIDIWCKVDKIPSVRWSAFKLALQIAKKHPELYDELRLITQGHYMDSLSPGIKNSVQKTMKAANNSHS